MHGVPAEAHIGMSLRDITGDETPHAEALLRPVLDTGQTHWLEVGRMLPGRTELGYWIANYFPLQSRAGRVEQVGTLCVEVTEQRELEEHFRKLGNELLWKKEEYHRLSRELHESINEYHAALGMRLDRLSRCTSNPERIPELLGRSMEFS